MHKTYGGIDRTGIGGLSNTPLSDGSLQVNRDSRVRRFGPTLALGLVCGTFVVLGLFNGGTTALTDSEASPAAVSYDADTGFIEFSEDVEKEITHHQHILTYHDFLALDSVKSWLEDDLGFNLTTIPFPLLLKYVPREIQLFYRPSYMRRNLGSAAAEGFVAFDLTYYDVSSSNYTASLFVIMRTNGSLHTVIPTKTIGDGGDLHFCGLKLKTSDSFLLGGNIATTQYGPQYLYHWKKNEFEMLNDGKSVNCHDLQWAYEGDAIWAPGGSKLIHELNTTNGEIMYNISMQTASSDINHVGMINKDNTAIVSSRMTNSIIKVHVPTKKLEWIAGGKLGQFRVKKLSGELLDVGSDIFVGQHNAEYFGENQYYMMDNQYDQGNVSRLLMVEINPEKKLVTELWEYKFEEYPWGLTPIYGDADRLPSGNVLGSFWPGSLSGKHHEDILYEARLLEIVEGTQEVAWKVDIYGKTGCSEDECKREYNGWKTYSVERFYEAPLIHNVHCNEKKIHFQTQNCFKQNNVYDGTYELEDKESGEILTNGTVSWKAHWRSTEVHVDIADLNITGNDVLIRVTNEWGDTATKEHSC